MPFAQSPVRQDHAANPTIAGLPVRGRSGGIAPLDHTTRLQPARHAILVERRPTPPVLSSPATSLGSCRRNLIDEGDELGDNLIWRFLHQPMSGSSDHIAFYVVGDEVGLIDECRT